MARVPAQAPCPPAPAVVVIVVLVLLEEKVAKDRRRQRMLHIFVRHPAARGSRRLVQDARAHPAHEAAPPLYKADI